MTERRGTMGSQGRNSTDESSPALSTPLSSSSEPLLTENTSSSSAGSSVGLENRQISRVQSLLAPRNRPRTSRACVSCQKRKTKCDGGRPRCKPCSRSNADCVYTTSKKENQRTQFHSLETKIHAYESLLRDILSQSTHENRDSLNEAILKHLKVPPELFSAFLASKSLSDPPLSTPRPGLSLGRMHLTDISDKDSLSLKLLQKPTVRVTSVHVWTSLVDNDIASHLLSLYFTWENPTWHLIDQDMFVHDLERGSRRFCSSLLVHTLLFFGCSFSFNLNRITDRREEKVLGEKLYTVIQQLWHEEQHNTDLPTAQSSILIGLLCCTFGIDRLGTKYIMQGAEISNRLNLQKENPTYFYCDIDDDPSSVARCQKLVSWAVFDIQALASQVYRKKPVWKGPPSMSLSQEEAAVMDEGVEWTPYPFQGPVSQPFFYTGAWIRSELVEIVFEISQFALKFPGAALTDGDWDYGYMLYQKLLAWKAKLPWSVLPRHNTTPHILCLQLAASFISLDTLLMLIASFYYYATLVFLCEMLILNSTGVPSHLQTTKKFDPPTVKSQALDTIGSLVLLFKHAHGWKSLPIVMLHYFCVAGVHSISKLHPHEPKWSLVLESCVVGLWHMSLGWGRLCKAFLRTIDLVLRAQKPSSSLVPPKVTAILQQLGGSLWTGADTSSLAADYMVHHVPADWGQNAGEGSQFKAHTLQSLLMAIEDLTMG